MNVDRMSNAELDYHAALALGANPALEQLENQAITGFAFKYFPARNGGTPIFRIVEPAGISIVWSPTTRWNDCAVLIRRMIAASPLWLSHPLDMPAVCQYDGAVVEADNPRLAIVRLYIAMRAVAPAPELKEGAA